MVESDRAASEHMIRNVRRGAPDRCPRTFPGRAEQRHHRLDTARERAGQDAGLRQAYSAPLRLSAGQTGVGHANRPGAGRGAMSRLWAVADGERVPGV